MYADKDGNIWVTDAEMKLLEEMFKARDQKIADMVCDDIMEMIKTELPKIWEERLKRKRVAPKVRFTLEYDPVSQGFEVIKPAPKKEVF